MPFGCAVVAKQYIAHTQSPCSLSVIELIKAYRVVSSTSQLMQYKGRPAEAKANLIAMKTSTDVVDDFTGPRHRRPD